MAASLRMQEKCRHWGNYYRQYGSNPGDESMDSSAKWTRSAFNLLLLHTKMAVSVVMVVVLIQVQFRYYKAPVIGRQNGFVGDCGWRKQ